MRLILTVSSVLALAFAAATAPLVAQDADAAKPRILVVSGANNHDWSWTAESLRDILVESGRFEVDVTLEPGKDLADAAKLGSYAALLLDYNGPRWGDQAEAAFLQAVKGGVGVVVVHAANNAFNGWTEYERMVGLCWRKGTGHGRFHPFDVEVVDHYHPVTAGMDGMTKHPDELYHRLVHMHDAEFRVLMSAYADPKTGGSGRHEPMATATTYGKGRVFHTPLGHVWKNVPASRASHTDPQFRLLVQRGTEWAATGAVTLPTRPINWLSSAERKAGFELLFDGESLQGWRGYKKDGVPAKGWTIDDGAIMHSKGGGGGDLMTDRKFGDFELRFEFKVGPKANSGVIYRIAETESASYMTGPEFQVLDDAGHGMKSDDRHGVGALYAIETSAKKQALPAGAWNTGRIVVKGWHVRHWVNGTKTVDLDLGSDAGRARIAATKFKAWSKFATEMEGHIALQDHGDAVWYRSIRVRALD